MICPRCSTLLPHDLSHVREHEVACAGNSVEEFLSKFASLADSIARMAKAGRTRKCQGECLTYGIPCADKLKWPEEIAERMPPRF